MPGPSQCTVTGTFENLTATPPAAGDLTLLVTVVDEIVVSGVVIRPGQQRFQCDATGLISASLIETASVARKVRFDVEYRDDYGHIQEFRLGWAQVPNTATVDISAMTFTPTDS